MIDDCFAGMFEPLGTVNSAFVAHLGALNPHSQYLLASGYAPGVTDHGVLGGLGDNDHPQYLLVTNYDSGPFDAQGTASGLLSAHVGLPDPHVQYLKESDYAAPITDHGVLGGLSDNDHPQYLLVTNYNAGPFDAQGTASGLLNAHLAAADPHSQYLFDSQVSAFGLTLIDDMDQATAQATIGYTAADVLSKLLGVDTDASGLNATTLQGNAPSTFATASAFSTHQALATAHGISAFGATLVDDADAPTARTTLGLVIGTNVQAQNTNLAALAGLTGAADKAPYFTGAGALALADFPTFGRSLVAAVSAAAGRTTLGLGTMATEASTAFLLATGATTGATSQAQTFTNGIISNAPNATNGTEIARFVGGSASNYLIARSVDASDLGGANLGNPAIGSTTGTVVLVANILMAAGKTFSISQTTYENGIITVGGSTALSGYIIRTGNDATYQGPFILRDGTNVEYFRVVPRSALTNTIQNTAIIKHNSTGTPAAGFGLGFSVQLKSSTTENRDAGRLTWEWITATDASRASKGQLTAYYTSTERAAMSWGANVSVALLSFYDVTTPIARQVLATGAGRTVDDVITFLQNLGLAKQS